MKKWNWVLLSLQWLVYGICVIDGICIAQGLSFLGTTLGNLVSGLFFAILAGRFFLIWHMGNRRSLRRLRTHALCVLCLSLGMLIIWLLLWRGNQLLYEAALYLLLLVSVPLPSCSWMILPVVGWALLLVGSWMLDRRWSRLPPGLQNTLTVNHLIIK